MRCLHRARRGEGGAWGEPIWHSPRRGATTYRVQGTRGDGLAGATTPALHEPKEQANTKGHPGGADKWT